MDLIIGFQRKTAQKSNSTEFNTSENIKQSVDKIVYIKKKNEHLKSYQMNT